MTLASIARHEVAGASDGRLHALVVAFLEHSVAILESRVALLENHIALLENPARPTVASAEHRGNT